MERKQKTLEEKIFLLLGKVFAFMLFIGAFSGILLYGFLHATTLN